MVTPEEEQYLRTALSPLCGPLHRVLDRAGEIADDHFAEYNVHDPSARNHLARLHAREILSGSSQLGPWSVVDGLPNAALHLRREMLIVRLLRLGSDGEVPAPGPNSRRRHAFANVGLSLFGVAASSMRALWSEPAGRSIVRIVRPVGVWPYGRPSQVDVDFYLPRDADDLGGLNFTPSDEGVLLDLPIDDVQGDDDAGNGIHG